LAGWPDTGGILGSSFFSCDSAAEARWSGDEIAAIAPDYPLLQR